MKVDLRYPALFGILAFFFILTTQQAIFGFETTSSSTLSTVGDSTGRKKPPSFFASPNTVTGLESEIEHWTPPAEVRAMNVCVSVYNDKHPDKGFESQVWPSPICEKWGKEGSSHDIFYPERGETAINHFKYLHDLIRFFSPHKVCLNEIRRVPLHQSGLTKGFDLRLEKNVLFPVYFGDEFEIVVKSLIQKRPKTYLEWGSGGSSRWLTALVSDKVVSVDNFKPWCDKVRQDPYVQCLENNGIFDQYCAAPKAGYQGNMAWGTYTGDDEIGNAMARDYVNAIDQFDTKRYDVILVDGRFRVGCALKALNYVDQNSIVIIHDFWKRREYHHILKYYDTSGRSRSAAVLRRKPVENLPFGWK
ncbi:hypothetical protein AAMO2058_000906400 [Amorphochlora amoebiformis]